MIFFFFLVLLPLVGDGGGGGRQSVCEVCLSGVRGGGLGGGYICEGFSLDDSETASAGHFRQEPD